MRIGCELKRYLESTRVIMLLIIAFILVNLYVFAGNEITSLMKRFNEAFPNTAQAILMGIISFATAYFIEEIREVRKRRRIIKALCDEIEINIYDINNIHPYLINNIKNSSKWPPITGETYPQVFDIPFFNTSAYKVACSSGDLLILSGGFRETIEKVYRLIEAHNRQRSKMETQEMQTDRLTDQQSKRIREIKKILLTILDELTKHFCYLPRARSRRPSSS